MNTELLLPLARGCPSAASGPMAETGASFNGQAANDFLAELGPSTTSDQEALLALVDRAEVFMGREV